MTPTAAIVVTGIICVTILLVVTILAYAMEGRNRPPRVIDPPRQVPAPAPEYYYEKTEVRPDPEPESSDPREGPAFPFDPENPPRPMTWKPSPGADVLSCLCHKKPLVPGQNVVLWPYQGRNIIFCLEGVPK